MSDLGRPRVPRSREREFWRGVRAGLSYAEAARATGGSIMTGNRWVNQGGGMPSLSLAEPSGRFLSLAEREEIALGLAAGHTQRAIGARLGRSPSTISREVARNRAGRVGWSYR